MAVCMYRLLKRLDKWVNRKRRAELDLRVASIVRTINQRSIYGGG